MGFKESLRHSALNRRTLAYILALLLPMLGTILAGKVSIFRPFPFAPYFISMGLIATIGGLWPTLVGLVITVLFYSGIVGQGVEPSEIANPDRYRYVFLTLTSLIVGIISQRRLTSENKLAIALAELHERTDALVDSLHTSKCASWTLDYATDPSVRWYSGSFPIFGRHYSEVQELSSLIPFSHPDDQPRFEALERDLHLTSDPIVFEFRCIWPNGELHWLEMRATRLPGRAPRWRGVTLDVTERHGAELLLQRSEKVVVMNLPTAAHEQQPSRATAFN
ncbi:PAS domain-containing protein [Granulicella paludicola]|uniref:PAS domain-containing protein n=1 Tax=Granulicella paludicola TaxID=474951 RepID=UPI0021E0A1A0|nr:PAS domain-containing protein [Granulicella paludicola]